MIILKTEEELERMRVSGRLAAELRDRVAERIEPGVTTAELDEYAQDILKSMEAESAFYGYHGYPGNICISINDEVVHGIPGKRKVKAGDIVSLDVGVRYEGFVGDTARTVIVGQVDEEVMRLVAVTEEALAAGIAQARAGKRLSDISHAIESVVEMAGFAVVREFVGHGVGRNLHEDPQIPNFGPPGRGPELRPGMTLAIEPMVNLGGAGVRVLKDGWTVVTKDGKPSAHFEHTVAVGPGPAEILTCQKEKE